jgi:hypothetical protein
MVGHHQCRLSDVTEDGCELPTSNTESTPVQGWFEGAYTESGGGGYGYAIEKDNDAIVRGGGINFDDQDDNHTIGENSKEIGLFIARFIALINATKYVDEEFNRCEVEFFGISKKMIVHARGKPVKRSVYRDYKTEFQRLRHEYSNLSSIRLKIIDIDDYENFSDTPVEYDRAREKAYEKAVER